MGSGGKVQKEKEGRSLLYFPVFCVALYSTERVACGAGEGAGEIASAIFYFSFSHNTPHA